MGTDQTAIKKQPQNPQNPQKPQNPQNNKKQNKFKQNKPTTLQTFFTYFGLDISYFDGNGDLTFNTLQKGVQIERRGGLPYYMPVVGKKYGLKIYGIYDNGDNSWLRCKNSKG